MRVAPQIALSDKERAELNQLVESVHTPERVASRARIVLLAAQGMQSKAIAEELGVGRVQVARWRERYAKWRLAGIESDAQRAAPPLKIDIARLAELTEETDAGRPWSTRRLAGELGVSAASVSRHLRTQGLKPSGAAAPERPVAEGGSPLREGRQLLPRDALIHRLVDARHRRCIVIQGQAGSGKTSTMLAWRNALRSLAFDVALCTLTAQDNDLTRFLQGVLRGFGEVDSAIVREASMLTGREGTESDIEHWAIALVQGLAKHPRDLVLVIEDLHHIEDRRIFQALQWLLDYAPAHLHLALSSRSALPLSLQRLRSQEMLAEFDMRDLRFSLDETARYLRKELGDIGADEVRAIHELTDGWVAGLQLFALDLRAKGRASYERVEVRDAQAFTSYFEREVLVRLAPEDLDMLTRAAICELLCGPLCAQLMGQPLGGARLASRLARLENDNFFIARVGAGDREAWYKPHPLLRETLLARLMKRPEQERRALHKVASKWFAAQGDVDGAVDHAVQAGALTEAADMVQACGHDLLARGEISQLWGLMRRLPNEQVEQRFDLHVLMAYLHMYSRNTDALEQSLQRMQQAAGAQDRRQRYYIVLLQSAVAVQRDDPDAVDRLLPAVRDIPPGSADLAWSSRSNVLSWFHISHGQYEEARHVFEETDAQSGAPRSSLLGKCMSALSLAHQGESRQAEEILREVLRTADARGTAYVGVACMAAGVLGNILREVDDLQAVRQLLEPRIMVLERVSLPDVVLLALLSLSDALWHDRQRDAASRCIDRLEAYATRDRLHRLHAEALMVRMRRHLLQDETERAIVTMERLEGLAALHGKEEGFTANKLRQAAARARIEMALSMRDWPAAERLLAPLVAELQAEGSSPRLAEAMMQLAIVRQGLGQPAEADAHVLASVRIGHRLGLVRSLLDVSRDVPALLRALSSRQELGPVLAFYVRRLEAAAVRPDVSEGVAASEAANPIEALSEREYEVLTLLAQAMPNKKIAKVIKVSPDTVKYHLKNIYAKLGVVARDEAVARLRELAAHKPVGGTS